MQYIKIDNEGTKFYYKDKEMRILYREEDGPAIEFENGDKLWYLYGEWIGGPRGVAIPSQRITKMQYVELDSLGNKYYYKDKEMTILHREDGPAVEHASGYKAWYLNGKLSREDGPAVECADGHKAWSLNGDFLTEKEFNNRQKRYCAHCGAKIEGK